MTCSYSWMDYVYFGLMCAVIVLLMVYILMCLRSLWVRRHRSPERVGDGSED